MVIHFYVPLFLDICSTRINMNIVFCAHHIKIPVLCQVLYLFCQAVFVIEEFNPLLLYNNKEITGEIFVNFPK